MQGCIASLRHEIALSQSVSRRLLKRPGSGEGQCRIYSHAGVSIQSGREANDGGISRAEKWQTCSFYERRSRISVVCLHPRSLRNSSIGRTKGGNNDANANVCGRRTGNILLYVGNTQRVLALASRWMGGDCLERRETESNMMFLGLVGISDPPRAESVHAIESCRRAGITVHMLTGDHIYTAIAIAKEVRILPNHFAPTSVLTAEQFDAMTNAEIDALPQLPLVIARCSPQTKVRMVDAIHRRSRLTAMTGDGINDTPSIKCADVGIAMGLGGSDVARQAAEMVLADDNFATVVTAIKDGRRIFDNQMKFILYLMSSNCAEVIVLVAGLGFLDSTGRSIYPLSPVQVLWENLITSAFPAFAYDSTSI